MKHRTPYSLVNVNEVSMQALVERRRGQRLVLGVDVAKGELVGCLVAPDRSFERPWRIQSPGKVRLLVSKLLELAKSCKSLIGNQKTGQSGNQKTGQSRYSSCRSFERPWRVKSPGEVRLLVSKLLELAKSCKSLIVASKRKGAKDIAKSGIWSTRPGGTNIRAQ